MSEFTDVAALMGRLCAIPSPSGKEAAVAAAVKGYLEEAGLHPAEDDAGPVVGGDCGNLFLRIPSADGAQSGGILLCAHLDTVPPVGEPEAILENGVWTNGKEGILGIDNKAAVAAILVACREWAKTPPATAVEVLLTVGEEVALKGAHAFDQSVLRSSAGFFFDHPTPLGTIVSSSPGHQRIQATFIGTAAHAGVAPLTGKSAVRAAARAIVESPHGIPMEGVTANVGWVKGGTAINVVPERCSLLAEVRAVDSDLGAKVVEEMTDACTNAANLEGVRVDVAATRTFEGYTHDDSHLAASLARDALSAIGRPVREVSSGGGSDANVFEARGLPCVNLGDGSSDTHTSDERISDVDLTDLSRLVLELPGAAASSGRT